MAIMPPFVGPRAAFKDLRAFLRGRSREQRLGAVLAVLSTTLIVLLFMIDSKVNTAPEPTITYVESWNANRTDEEIVADNEKRQAEKEAAIEARRQAFEDLEKLNNSIGLE
ncbi:hypothetical protein [Sphingomicrobium nitratireducens]|uniref:hypothetical protein n=1 Tax=Sphingomicrobium nitratireducens TaxID=2964666 RepID=UPI00223FCCAC|nr:hypothetical protein [Sphingomicrobium nitratireducens]